MEGPYCDGLPVRCGDLLTRDGLDVHRVVAIIAFDCVEVECVIAPTEGWCAIGDRETNLIRRYSRATPERLG